MKHIKLYEDTNNEPQIGDYVVCYRNRAKDAVKLFFSENIGRITKFNMIVRNYRIKFEIKFSSTDKAEKYDFTKGQFQFLEHPDGVIVADKEHIIFFSPSKEDCEVFLASKKYNL